MKRPKKLNGKKSTIPSTQPNSITKRTDFPERIENMVSWGI